MQVYYATIETIDRLVDKPRKSKTRTKRWSISGNGDS